MSNTTPYNQCLPLTAFSYRPYCEFSSILLLCWNNLSKFHSPTHSRHIMNTTHKHQNTLLWDEFKITKGYQLKVKALKRDWWHLSYSSLVIISIYWKHHNRHFQKSPFAISLKFLFTIWRFWRLIDISAIFVKYAIFARIATFQRAPLPCHLNFCCSLAILAFNRHFHQIRHFRQNLHFPKGPFANSFEFLFTVWRFWRLRATVRKNRPKS